MKYTRSRFSSGLLRFPSYTFLPFTTTAKRFSWSFFFLFHGGDLECYFSQINLSFRSLDKMYSHWERWSFFGKLPTKCDYLSGTLLIIMDDTAICVTDQLLLIISPSFPFQIFVTNKYSCVIGGSRGT